MDKNGAKKFDIKNVLILLMRSMIIIAVLSALVIAFFIIKKIFFRVDVVQGSSMNPGLVDGDYVLELTHFDIDNGDIVIIQSSKLGRIVKRVIAVEGQEVNIDFEKGEVYVDGKLLDEQVYEEGEKLKGDYFINTPTTKDMGAFDKYPVTVPDGYIFVLGDNRNHSKDSKHSDLGFVPEDEVTAQVLMKTKPFRLIK